MITWPSTIYCHAASLPIDDFTARRRLTAADTRQITLLGLLDMSAAFDCVDQSTLLLRLERNFGVTGLALQWMTSFLTDRTQQVAYSHALSKSERMPYAAFRKARCWARYFSTCTRQTSAKLWSLTVSAGCISTQTTARFTSVFL